jgi:site-specific DNA recombinase
MKTAIIYARYSSDNQRHESITAQVRACTAYAQKEGYSIINQYIDEAKSARSNDRPALDKMFKDLKSRKFLPDALIIHKLDRLARNRYESAINRHELKKAGVSLISVLERIDDSPESVILESLLEGMAEYYSLNLAREVNKGMIETALDGKHTGGRAPYGYIVGPDQKYQPNPKTAGAIKIIFEMFASGSNYNKIITELTNKGYTAYCGGEIKKTALYEILNNKKYTGTFVFNRSAKVDVNGKRNHHKSKDPEEIVEILNAFPALVSMELFNRCQMILKSRVNKSIAGQSYSKYVYLLSGKIICGECGEKVYAGSYDYTTKISKELRERPTYFCSSKKRNGCVLKRISRDELEEFILKELNFMLSDMDKCIDMAKLLYGKMINDNEESKGEGNKINKAIANIKKRIDHTVSLLMKCPVSQSEALLAVLQADESEKKMLENELRLWNISQKGRLTEQMILKFLLSQKERLETGTDENRKNVIDIFIKSITVFNSEVKFVLNIIDGDNNGGGGGS